MSGVYVAGIGAVTPAGWGIPSLRSALASGQPVAASQVPRPGWEKPLWVRRVPAPNPRPAFLAHPRLRRSSAISHFAIGATLEALEAQSGGVAFQPSRLGIVFCVLAGCLNYTRRFYEEAYRDAATASPLLFPETVFNAPASHLAAYLGTLAESCTLLGDPGMFLVGLAIGADWIRSGRVADCVVVGAEEADWMSADAWRHFERGVPPGEGAGALLLRGGEPAGALAELIAVSDPALHGSSGGRHGAALAVRNELRELEADLLCDSRCGSRRLDAPEDAAWRDWQGRLLSPKRLLGEGLAAGSAWQCAAACDAIREGLANQAVVSVTGTNQQAIGAVFRSIGDG